MIGREISIAGTPGRTHTKTPIGNAKISTTLSQVRNSDI